jgi:DNA-binding SARP family transcriptional activator
VKTAVEGGSPTVRFEVLGPVRLWRSGLEREIGPRQQRLILALLLARAGQPVGISEIVELVWKQNPPDSAVNVVYRCVGALRRLIEPGLPSRSAGRWLVHQASGYRLLVDTDDLDLLKFRDLAGQAKHAEAAEMHADAVRLYVEALSLWRGSCAGGSELLHRSHNAFEAVDQERVAVALQAAEVALRCGGARSTLAALRTVAELNPLDEALQAQLIRLLSADGKQAEAIAAYREIRRRLADELGVDPGGDLRAAYLDVLRQGITVVGTAGRSTPTDDAVDDPSTGGYGDRGDDRPPQPVRPAQLPPSLSCFTGRDEILRRTITLLGERTTEDPRPAILAFDGPPGIGKTALATHLAHRLVEAYPDGQLYIDLRGFDAEGPAVDAAETLQAFLSALGVPHADIPPGLDARSGLYRSVLAGRRVLVVLDNAHDVEQVRPLLPGTAECLVLLTSRNRLTGLATAYGAELVTLDVPSRDEARAGLIARIGAARAEAEPEAVNDIIDRCGALPLALAVVAARAATHPEHRLSAVVRELLEAQGSLDGFSSADMSNELRAIFSWSYLKLTPSAARAFRLMALHPGPDITMPAFVSLTGAPLRDARSLIGELIRTGLLTEHKRGRYRTHDLIRAYACELSMDSSEEERRLARDRIYHHYRQSAHRATTELGSLLVLDPPEAFAGLMPAEITDAAQATTWFNAERHIVEAMVRREIEEGRTTNGWQLALTLQTFYQSDGWYLDWANTVTLALGAARASGDVRGQAYLLRSLAGASHLLGDNDEARSLLLQAMERFIDLGYLLEQALIHINLGRIDHLTKNYPRSVTHYERALRLLEPLGHQLNRANALCGLGENLICLGRHAAAMPLIHEALDLHRHGGDLNGQGMCHELLAQSYHAGGEYERSLAHRREAIELYRQSSWRTNLAECYVDLGDTALASGDAAAARAAWEEALALLDRLPPSQTAEVEARLARLTQVTGPNELARR